MTVTEWIKWSVSFLEDKNQRLSTSKVMVFAIFISACAGVKMGHLTMFILTGTSLGYSAWKDVAQIFEHIVTRKVDNAK